MKRKLVSVLLAGILCCSTAVEVSAAYEEYLPEVTGFQQTTTMVDGSSYTELTIHADKTYHSDAPDGISSFIRLSEENSSSAGRNGTTAKMMYLAAPEFVNCYGPLADSRNPGDQFTLKVWETVENWDLSQPDPYGGTQAQRDSGYRLRITVEEALPLPQEIVFTPYEGQFNSTAWRADFGTGYESGSYRLLLDYGDREAVFTASVPNNTHLVFSGRGSQSFDGNLQGATITLRRVRYGGISTDGKTAYLTVSQAQQSASEPGVTGDQPSSWAQAEVAEARQKGLIPQELDSQYQTNITRAQFCHLAAALLEQKTGREMEEILAGSGASPLTFTDTQDPIVSMLSALGVVNGKGNGLFEPQADITREEAAVMLWRLAQQLGTVEPNRSQITFSDAGQISSWAKQAVSVISACEYNGNAIMNGTGNNQFSPRQQYTREQAILTMLRLGQYMD